MLEVTMTTKSKSHKEEIEKISKMIKSVEVAMLVTMDSDGKFHSRPMTTQEMDFNGEIWFFAERDSEVVKEIQNHPELNVAYSEDGKYVSVSGKGSIVTNNAKKRELWHPELKVWFEGKEAESADVVLIKVQANEADYWETGDGMIGNAVRTLIAAVGGREATPIESGHTKIKR
jgi:general stress protein 26